MNSQTQKQQRRVPDFVGIGGQRCATSWLYECLCCHPQVFMPEKELQYFNRPNVSGADWYLDQFVGAGESQICGEFTPNYLESPQAMDRLCELLPKAKLLVSLRNPIDRAYSAYRLFVSHGKIAEKTFEEALAKHHFLVDHGMFGQHLERLLKVCPREQVKVIFYSRIMADPKPVVTELYRWLGIDSDFHPPSLNKYFNVSTVPKLQRMFSLPRIQNMLAKTPIGPFLRWLKHTTLSTWYRRNSALHWNQPAAAAFVKLGLMERLMADTELLQTLVDEPIPWKPFFDDVYQKGLRKGLNQQSSSGEDNRAETDAVDLYIPKS